MDTRLLVDICHSANQLREYPLDLVDRELPMLDQVVVQLVSGTIFQDQPHQRLGHYDLVQSGNVRVDELSVVVDLAGQVRVALVCRLEYDFGAVCELVVGEVDLAKRPFPY